MRTNNSLRIPLPLFLKHGFLFIILLLSGLISAQHEQNDSSRTFLFIGPGVHASYRGTSTDHEVHLSPEFSPGLELGIGHRRTLTSDVNISLTLGADIAVIRNSMITDFESTRVFETAQYYSLFLEGGFSLHAEPSGHGFNFFGGYRLCAFLPSTFGYGEISQTEEFHVESMINPNPTLFHAMVLRPAYTFKSKNASKSYGIAIQGVVGGTNQLCPLVEGEFTYESEGNTSFGGFDADLAHLSVLWQVYW